jgi:hypothetical protein
MLETVAGSCQKGEHPIDRDLSTQDEETVRALILLRQIVQSAAQRACAEQDLQDAEHERKRKAPSGDQSRRQHAERPAPMAQGPLVTAPKPGDGKPFEIHARDIDDFAEIQPMSHRTGHPCTDRAAIPVIRDQPVDLGPQLGEHGQG